MMSMNPAWTDQSAIPPASHTVPLQQSAAYHRTCAALGHKTLCLTFGDVSAPLGQAHVLFRQVPVIGTIAAITGGPIWAEDLSSTQKLTALTRLTERLNARTILITPADQNDPIAPRAIPIMTPATSAVWDLRSDLRAGLCQKWRNRLGKAERASLSIRREPLPDTPSHWLLKTNAEQAKLKRFRPYPPTFIATWARTGGKGFTLTALHDHQTVAALLVLIHGHSATYQIAWTTPQGRSLHAQNLLLFYAALSLQDRGITRFDLGILDTERAAGLARFKLGTGAQAHNQGPTTLIAPFTRLFAK